SSVLSDELACQAARCGPRCGVLLLLRTADETVVVIGSGNRLESNMQAGRSALGDRDASFRVDPKRLHVEDVHDFVSAVFVELHCRLHSAHHYVLARHAAVAFLLLAHLVSFVQFSEPHRATSAWIVINSRSAFKIILRTCWTLAT